ncbi:hypothetical protein TeGR_g6490 [Tetraparma gracilis]|uniref:Dimethylargininase n=1 Tax=Tetraparma gracilis TaxID=2962635 RepID=A0ABQ6ND12_9STRA|nr:hypothetical protein TeGR_g6490 [Tetraparma gracilis]
MLARFRPAARKLSSLALVRPPSPNYADGLVTHISAPSSSDFPLALSQWESYVNVFDEHAGWSTLHLPPISSCPDAHFVEDQAVAFKHPGGGNLVVPCPMGAPERAPEAKRMHLSLLDLASVGSPALRSVAQLDTSGTMDGGDVLKVGSTVYVGQTLRSSVDAIAALSDLLSPLGYSVVAVPLKKALHLKSAVTALPDGAIVGFEELLEDSSVFPDFLPVANEPSAHVVVLDEKTVLMSSAAGEETTRMLEKRGFGVVGVDISEFEKLEGCVTCLSVRLRE